MAGSPVLAGLLISGAALLLIGQGTGIASAVLPSPQELPPRVVAVVTGVPTHLETIHKSDFDRAMAQEAAQAHLKRMPAPGERRYKNFKKTAVGNLLDESWIQGQAAEMGIQVTPREVVAEFAQIKKQNFKSDAEYKQFLRASHYTQANANERVRLKLLATGIDEQIARGVRAKKATERAFATFVAEYMQRWRSRTVCAPVYVFDRCSNEPPFKHGEANPPAGG